MSFVFLKIQSTQQERPTEVRMNELFSTFNMQNTTHPNSCADEKNKQNKANPSPQKVQNPPAKQEKQQHPNPEYPLILLGPSFHHPDRIPAHPQRISSTIQPSLRPLEHLPLLSQVRQHRAPPVKKLVQLVAGVAQEGLFAQRVRFAVVVSRRCTEAQTGS